MADICGPVSDLLSVLPPDVIDKKYSQACQTILSSICDLLIRPAGSAYFVKTVLWLKHWHPAPLTPGEQTIKRFFTLSAALFAVEPEWREFGTAMKNGSGFAKSRDPFGDSKRGCSSVYSDFEKQLASEFGEAARRFSYSRPLLVRLASVTLTSSLASGARPLPADVFELLLGSISQCSLGELARLMAAVKDVYRYRAGPVPQTTRRQAGALRKALSNEVKLRMREGSDEYSLDQIASLTR
jgi:hypothetical protein